MFKIDDSYLEDEVRDGFYIPSISKRAFAAELSLLNELNRICEKYNITYLAEWGTLIGAVRHRGFIPWDDDLDICMHRNDLDKLIEVADKELPDGFEIHSFENNDYSWKFVYNLVNTERMCFDPEYLKTHYNFPYMATIDIFVHDNITDDEEYEEKRRSDIKAILEVADITTDENIKKPEYFAALDAVEKLRDISIDRKLPAVEIKRQLYYAAQNIFREQNDKETPEVCQMIPWGVYNKSRLPQSYFNKTVSVPFENITIPVSDKYYTLVSELRFGNFWEIKIGTAGHDYPYYKGQKEMLGTDMDYVPRYKFSEDQLKKDASAKENSLKAIAEGYSEYLKISYNDILDTVTKEAVPDIVDILSGCQDNAIQFGTLVEKVKGENTATVPCLEKYCELLFRISQVAEDKQNALQIIENEFKPCIDGILLNIASEIINRRTVVFFPFKGEYFDSMLPYYMEETQKPDTDVIVVPLPYYYKEYNGAVKEPAQYDLSRYPESVSLADYRQIDLNLIYPDVIYIQNPYDEYNMAISVPNYFYASNLHNLTDRLVYIPWFKTLDFDSDCYPSVYNMQYYCNVPGVVLSDTVYVSSETIRDRYIEKLTEFSGEQYKDTWEEKIKVSPFCANTDNDMTAPSKKCLCFYTCPGQMLEFKDKYLDKIKNCIDIFNEASENINVIWRIEPYELDIVKTNDEDIYNKLTGIINSVNNADNIMVEYNMKESELVKVCDAFYGDGSYLSKDFIIARKPVMIMDMNVM